MGGSPVDNNAKLFRQGQMTVLNPLIKDGKIKIVGDQWVDAWLPENALKIMENALTATITILMLWWPLMMQPPVVPFRL